MDEIMTKEIENEKAFLCSVLQNEEILYRVNIDPDDLTDMNHRMILKACIELSADNTKPDLTAVAHHLHGKINPGEIVGLTNIGVIPNNWKFYAQTLMKNIMLRKLSKLPMIVNDLMASRKEPEEIISDASEYMDNIQINFNHIK